MAPLLTGQRLLHYQILEKIGEGGMGVVYKARDTRLDRLVAIKLLQTGKTADEDRRARFMQEARAASALLHPNIIVLYDIASEDGHDFMVLEYVPGKTLDELIARKGLRLGTAVRYAAMTADALARAHSAGIVHRDIKPANLMVDEHGQVKVLDFGLAKLKEVAPREDDESTRSIAAVTGEGRIVGTTAYMSPEQAEGRAIDTRSDIFSFGATLYEMLTGRRPFTGDSSLGVLASIVRADPAPIGDDIPLELQRIVLRCLRKDPARRWQTMADLKVALEDFRDESESSKSLPAQKPLKRTGVWKLAGGTLLVGLIALAAGLYYRPAPPRSAEAAYKAVPLTSYPGRQLHPTFSPDGSQVAFSWCNGSGCAIYVKQLGVEEPYRLSAPPDNAEHPEWSPDGSHIAFRRMVDSPSPMWQYVVVPQRGGAERKLAEFPHPSPLSFDSARAITWFPDSRRLLVMAAERPRELASFYELSAFGGVRRKVLDAGTGPALKNPSLSPDGTMLAFTVSEGQSDLYVVPVSEDGAQTARVRVAASVALTSAAVWTSDGRELVYLAGGRNDGERLWKSPPRADAVPVRVPIAEQRISGRLAMSRTGALAWVQVDGVHADVFRIRQEAGGRFGSPELLIASMADDSQAEISPDGTRIVFSSTRSGVRGIWLADRDGAGPVLLTSDGPSNPERPRWSPDGRQIAVYGGAGQSSDVYIIDAAGGKPRKLTDSRARYTNPEWSCDGHFIYAQIATTGMGTVNKIPAAGGTPVPVVQAGMARETSDCQYLVYGTDWPERYRVWRRRLDGSGEPEVIAEGVYAFAGFQVHPEGMYYFGASASTEGYPLLMRAANGAVKELARVQRPFWGLSVSPDRRTIVFASRTEGSSNIHMIQGFR